MTREEAFDGIYYADTFDLAQEMVNKIYDDFESRTCENCMYYTSTRLCTNSDSYVIGNVDKNFGCNKFEGKES